MNTRLIAIVAVLGLSGCAAQNVKSDYSLAQAKADGKGLLVFSLTTDDPNSPYIPSLIFAFGDEPRGDDEGKPIEGLKGCSSAASEFKDGCGRLVVLEEDAGDYYVHPWRLDLFPPVRTCAPTDWAPMPFHVAAGQVTYLGDIHAVLKPGNLDRLGNTKIGFAWTTVSDRHERDVALLIERYPGIRTADVINAALSFPPAGDPAHPVDENCGRP